MVLQFSEECLKDTAEFHVHSQNYIPIKTCFSYKERDGFSRCQLDKFTVGSKSQVGLFICTFSLVTKVMELK